MKVHVVNVRSFPFECPTPYIYVGRYMPGIFAGHQLGNPFKLPKKAKQQDRVECLEKYRSWLLARPDFEEQIEILVRKVVVTGLPLGCWCAPKLCHADVLAELINERLSQ